MSLAEVLVFAGLAGAAIPAGALAAYVDRHHREDEHAGLQRGIIAFGGGVLIGAVALVLVPEGTHALSIGAAAAAFAFGSVSILLVDRAIERRGTRRGQVLAMVLDFVPESIALGAVFGMPGPTGPLLALLIGLQNLPEAFNSFRELEEGGASRRSALATLAPLALLGPAAAALGFLFLQGHASAVGALALAASGGIVYLVFHDVAPAAFKQGHWLSTLGASAGFLVAMVGEALVS